jgi:hypothetical protein
MYVLTYTVLRAIAKAAKKFAEKSVGDAADG